MQSLRMDDEVLLDDGLEDQEPFQAEAQRLRKNDALGEPVTEGETPRIEPKENQGLLEGLF